MDVKSSTSDKKYKIHEHCDFGGWGALWGTFTYDEAVKEVKRMYSFGSIFMSYGIWDEEEKRYVR